MVSEEQSIGWYALYTKSRSEKKVNSRLLELGFETYLPLKKELRQWSDRKKVVELPLFNSYIFVKTYQSKLYELIKVAGVTKFISFSGRPVSVREREIEILKELLASNSELEIIDGIPELGKLVKFSKGILKGYEGRILKINRRNQYAVEIESLGKSIIVNIKLDD